MKQCPHFGGIETIFKMPNPMGLCTNPMLKCKNQNLDFILEYKYSQTHRMLQLRKFVRLLWIKHSFYVWDYLS